MNRQVEAKHGQGFKGIKTNPHLTVSRGFEKNVGKILGELIASDYMPHLEKLGIVRTLQWDAVTGPSGVPLPLKAGYSVNHTLLLFLSVFVVLLFILYYLRLKSRSRGKGLG